MTLLPFLLFVLIAGGVALACLRGWGASRQEGQLYNIRAPLADSDPTELFMTLSGLLISPWHRFLFGQPHLVLETRGHAGRVEFLIHIPDRQHRLVESLLAAYYPGIELTPDEGRLPGGQSRAVRLGLSGRHEYPLRTDHKEESLTALWTALSRTNSDETVLVQIVIRPASPRLSSQLLLLADRIRQGARRNQLLEAIAPRRGKVTASHLDRQLAGDIETKASRPLFTCTARILATSSTGAASRHLIAAILASLRTLSGSNGLRGRRVIWPSRFIGKAKLRQTAWFGGFLLNAAELGALWHLPSSPLPGLASIAPASVPPPLDAPRTGRVLGVATSNHTGKRPVALSSADSLLHTFMIGATGTGKSTLQLHLAVQAVVAGDSLVVIDPSGDLVTDLMNRLPESVWDRVVPISPAESAWAIGLNPLQPRPGQDPVLAAEEMLAIIRQAVGDWGWGIRTAQILQASLLTLSKRPGSSLADVEPLLTERAFRMRIVQGVTDPGLHSFWQSFERLTDPQRMEQVAAPLGRLRAFLLMPRVRRLLCQPSTIDLRSLLDHGGIVLADLNISHWGEGAAALCGSILFSAATQAIRQRVDTPKEKRRRTLLIVDELRQFVEYSVSGFAAMIASSRGLGLGMCLSAQHLGQLSRELREALAQNARTSIVFQTGREDAHALAAEFAPLDAKQLLSLPQYRAAVRLAINGRTSNAFTIDTLEPPPVRTGSVGPLIEAALRRHGRSVGEVDAAFQRSLERPELTVPSQAPVGRRQR